MINKLRKGEDYIGVGGGVLILNDLEEVLLMKRGGDVRNEVGWWSKPGGGVKFGETVIDAMKREILEEIGVKIKITGYLPHTDHIIELESQHWVAFNFVAQITEAEPQNMEPGKCDAVEWFTLNNLPEKITQTTSESIANYVDGKYITI